MCKGHWSDCAVHNGPAFPVGECDCGGLELTSDLRDRLIPAPITKTGSERSLGEQSQADGFVESQHFPSHGLIADASATNLPNTHHRVVLFRVPTSVDLDHPREAVVPNLKANP